MVFDLAVMVFCATPKALARSGLLMQGSKLSSWRKLTTPRAWMMAAAQVLGWPRVISMAERLRDRTRAISRARRW